jgi:large subunit ribosomal protein L7/L12
MTNAIHTPEIAAIGDRIVALTSASAAQLNRYLKAAYGIESVCASVIADDVQPDVVIEDGQVVPVEFDVVLEAVEPARKIAAIKAVRQATAYGLKEAKELVEGTPRIVAERLTRAAADELMAILTSAGCKAVVRGRPV